MPLNGALSIVYFLFIYFFFFQKSFPNNTHSDVDSDSDVSFDSAGKKKSFERLWVRFAEKTSMQGIPYIHNAKLKWAKVIWALLTLAAIAAMIAHLYYLIAQYYSWPKQTKISLGFSNLKIPDVTICNTNIIKRSVLSDYTGAEELKEVLDFVSTENLVPNDSEYDGTGGSGTNQPHGEPKVWFIAVFSKNIWTTRNSFRSVNITIGDAQCKMGLCLSGFQTK